MKSARRILRTVLLVQAAAALAIACAAMAWGGAGFLRALALGAACVALVRLAINMNNFVVSSLYASPTPPEYRLRGTARLRLLWEEFRSSMLHTSGTCRARLPAGTFIRTRKEHRCCSCTAMAATAATGPTCARAWNARASAMRRSTWSPLPPRSTATCP
ncbi:MULTISPECIES: hypothetical protein [unclassified Massilia]|uniref:hypothetical protein n=1 Tax=unclassified Massilia TaxID=2609279 RepID=UPI001E39924D|nr:MULTISPECIES: hypothetical protein [unclassified Massilia]